MSSMKNRIVKPKHDIMDGEFCLNIEGKAYRILTDMFYDESKNIVVIVESEDVPQWRENEYTLSMLQEKFKLG